MAPSALWTFAHRALSPQFHEDPARFVAMLDGNAAPRYLEQMWAWALSTAGATEPPRPPLRYGIDRPRPGLAIVWMSFRDVTQTGEPWQIRFFVRDPDAGAANGYTRMFLLEHSEYATELAGGTATAIVCESERGGAHRNWGATFAPTDEPGFDDFVVATIRAGAAPTASTRPS
ncbi:MAG TPA: hypothetical protein VNO30_09310 [Kofleriaceae bacterium]|nr:hypothetical protein [Kofleriaceae bacterium]